MQHSGRAFPVIEVDGLSFNVRRKGGGTFGELAAAYTQEIIKSLPQNNAVSKVVNHAIAEDCTRRPSAVGAGQHDVLRDMQGRSEAEQ